MLEHSAAVFWQLIRTPFQHTELVWGIVPLYFGWLLNELTSGKASFKTAIQTGFSFLWAAAQWLFQHTSPRPGAMLELRGGAAAAVSFLVTLLVLAVGIVALISGLRRRYPRRCAFLGHTRFSNYFMIAIFPIQAGYMGWTWDRLAAVLIWAVPVWLVVNLILRTVRHERS